MAAAADGRDDATGAALADVAARRCLDGCFFSAETRDVVGRALRGVGRSPALERVRAFLLRDGSEAPFLQNDDDKGHFAAALANASLTDDDFCLPEALTLAPAVAATMAATAARLDGAPVLEACRGIFSRMDAADGDVAVLDAAFFATPRRHPAKALRPLLVDFYEKFGPRADGAEWASKVSRECLDGDLAAVAPPSLAAAIVQAADALDPKVLAAAAPRVDDGAGKG